MGPIFNKSFIDKRDLWIPCARDPLKKLKRASQKKKKKK